MATEILGILAIFAGLVAIWVAPLGGISIRGKEDASPTNVFVVLAGLAMIVAGAITLVVSLAPAR